MKKLIQTIAFAGTLAISSCNQINSSAGNNDYKVSTIDSTTKKIGDCIGSVDTLSLSVEEKELEKTRQLNFYEDYAKEYSGLYGDRLYTNTELLCADFSPKVLGEGSYFNISPKVRLLQYFLRNDREQTFKAAEKLGCIHHQTSLTKDHVLTTLFSDAKIDIEGETIDRIEVPDGRSGGTYREGSKYGGNDEIIMTVEQFSTKLNNREQEPAQKAGYKVDPKVDFEGTINNEMSHEIQYKYFRKLFEGDDHKRLEEPFKSFLSEISNLKFQNNAQAAEFLSDVADRSSGSKYFRFFNPLYYMSENSTLGGGRQDRYWYSYQVQKYAMEQVLKNKGHKNYKKIVYNLIEQANNSDYKNHDELYISAYKYFQEEDLKEIAKIYRRIGIELLETMKPYFKKEK